MIFLSKYTTALIFTLLLSMGMVSKSYAHVMVAQHGTLNVVENGVFMVLSIPVTAFEGIDDDNDGMLSMEEFNTHRPRIAKAVIENVVLRDITGKIPLQGMMLSPVTSHGTSVMPHISPKVPTSQIVVMGRFSLDGTSHNLQYQINLFGKHSTEQLMKMTMTRKGDNQELTFELTPKDRMVSLFLKEHSILLKN